MENGAYFKFVEIITNIYKIPEKIPSTDNKQPTYVFTEAQTGLSECYFIL